jgi:hypothetical protein
MDAKQPFILGAKNLKRRFLSERANMRVGKVVLPLSNFHPTHTVTSTSVAIITHIVRVGLPISLVVRHYSS